MSLFNIYKIYYILPISAKEIGPTLFGSFPDLEKTNPLSTEFFQIS